VAEGAGVKSVGTRIGVVAATLSFEGIDVATPNLVSSPVVTSSSYSETVGRTLHFIGGFCDLRPNEYIRIEERT
jgi:hypothetical protein